MFNGVFTTLLTPFSGDDIDEPPFAACTDFQVAQGVAGLVTCAIAGEGPTLSPAERYRLTRIAVEVAARRVPVLAAAGTNCTATTIELARAARTAGASAVILVVPYYSKPSQEGIFRHVEAVARAVDLPIIVENAPSRTNVEIAPATLERLAGLPAVVGLLDGASDPQRLMDNAKACGDRLIRLAPRETAPAIGLPAPQACLSLAANIAPRHCCAAWDAGPASCTLASISGAYDMAGTRLRLLYRALDMEPEPIAAKYAASLHHPGFDSRPRLPLTPAREETCAMIRVVLAHLAGVLTSAPAEPCGFASGDVPAPLI